MDSLGPSAHDLRDASRVLASDARRIEALLLIAVLLAAAGVTLVTAGWPTTGWWMVLGSLGAVGTAVSVRADSRRLLTDLVAQGDAFSLPPVRSHADRLLHQRVVIATGLQRAVDALQAPAAAVSPYCVERVQTHARRLEGLADAFSNERIQVTPVSAALCMRLLCEPVVSPLFNDRLPTDSLDRILTTIERGVGRPGAEA